MASLATAQPAQPLVRTTYPLHALLPSTDNNVRKKKRTPESVLAMAHSISAHGCLLQNLVVVPEAKQGKRTGRAFVAAGETRRLALCLIRDGKVDDVEPIPADYPVDVLEVPDHEAAAASATENIQRTQMHPADEFKAFAQLFDQCGSIEQVAAMFGVKELFVRQRLKLAAASPALFEVFSNDGMSLEQLMALCISDDHAAQERVWNAARSQQWARSPDSLRQALTAEEVASTAPLARFVSIKAYENAGGAVRSDLFGQDADTYLIDSTLLKTLAEQKLQKHADELRGEGWAWIEVRAQATNMYDVNYARATKGLRNLSDDERKKLADLQAKHDEADRARDALYERDDEDLNDAEQEQARTLSETIERRRTQLSRLRESLSGWTPEVLAHAGALVTFDNSGKIVTCRGLIRQEDRKAAAKARAAAEAANEPKVEGAEPSKVEAPKSSVSESLMRRLTAHRTVALQRMLADNTQVAMAALAHALVRRVLDDESSPRVGSALDLQAKGCERQLDAATESTVKASRAWTELQELRHQWGERMPGDPASLLPWLIKLPMSELCDLIALCVSLTVNAVQPSHLKHPSDSLGEAVGLDMADWWQPTAAEYLNCVPKAMICAALADSGMTAEASTLEKLKKGEAVAKAEALLQGKRWLPAALKPRG
ncbi:ParB/RepB/Spo0J family partition protein [Aquincola sp. S2]|uniref:ParB/RepB/Spo0J family partition protein n=1 Tax=Pseudaquabacterium terrae TaxID=2732868 RepID=A0ABX2ES42_9BURK|nr:ParB/RepB/Spo0J family partition protein [Aquabacterium terrae]NRF71423.1 ParB/RepB/Spo0J family partition protein [Aquabacterium terrae]